jgi:hypothetical protein
MKRTLLLPLGVLLAAGCTSQAAKKPAANAFSISEQPPASATELRQVQVRARAVELLSTGKQTSRTAALNAAEREVPDYDAAARAAWSQQMGQALKQKAAQDKFESELAAMLRN